MLLKAGLLSLALLLASRLLGLARESAQAAAFGASGLGDLAVLMVTLPDWITGLVAAGALSYVLVPAWAGQPPSEVARTQRRVAGALVGLGLAVGLALVLALVVRPGGVLGALAPGLPAGLSQAAASGLAWSAAALAPALLASLWATRLQHHGDVVGLYGANLVVNAALVAAILAAGLVAGAPAAVAAGAGMTPVLVLGAGLLAAMGLRLAWQAWRMAQVAPDPAASIPAGSVPAGLGGAPLALPPVPVWAWAILSAGLPLALPFAARSLASAQGEGALALFNYAWKLVELPLILAIQLVATLAFPRVAAAVAGGLERAEARETVRVAFALSWALACAAAAGLVVGAAPLAQLLFGWGRMDAEALARVADWGRLGAWSLLPQALSAVALTVLASQRRLRPAAGWHALALGLLLVAGDWAPREGGVLMLALDAAYLLVALGVLAAMGQGVVGWLPWRAMLAPLAMLVVAGVVSEVMPLPSAQGLAGRAGAWLPVAAGLALAGVAAASVLVSAWVAGGRLRAGLRR